MSLRYVVGCRFADAQVLERWVEWLEREHLADVCAAGALRAEILRAEQESYVEVHYTFASREAFATYERESAPRLREEGLRLFPLSLGLEYRRATFDVQGHYP
ncbi:MAG: DUF4286 family protein [Polyangiaceae bacterium]|nr:DUF4286 family protein [Myxococcales bacterium]MCB9589477.1 DUF4286 family protein [Polyangiaceae bacterium]MCB9609956.1 DUF4286 family protein [Polyangiaceae bacterium]